MVLQTDESLDLPAAVAHLDVNVTVKGGDGFDMDFGIVLFNSRNKVNGVCVRVFVFVSECVCVCVCCVYVCICVCVSVACRD